MNLKTLAGKTIFFALICLFVALYSQLFGGENSLTGVIIVVLALMMLGQDMSVRPLWNLGGLLGFTMAMGLGAFVSVWCGNAFVGAAINFAFVFAVCFATTQNLMSPMHFPFLLGYAFMLSVPVSPEELPMRLLALALGSVLTVGLNVLVHRGSGARVSHRAVMDLCDQVSACCTEALGGGSPSTEELDRTCAALKSRIRGRLRDRFFTTPSDRTVLNLASSLQMVGHGVCSGERDPEVLRALADLMGSIRSHEDGAMDVGSVRAEISAFLRGHPRADAVVAAALATADDELAALAGDRGDEPAPGRVPAREWLRTDSVRTTFAIRMSVLFTLWAFVWQYWGLENAKWLLFTTVALVLPYVDNAWRKSAMRLTGTLAGVAVFALVLAAADGSLAVMTVALLAANYVYTVLDPKRYDVMMVFITFSALVAASMADPASEAVAERVLYIVLGVLAATAANYLLLPYRLRDENRELAGRYLGVTRGQTSCLERSLAGDRDANEEAALVLTASGISAKMSANLQADPDGAAEGFLAGQEAVTSLGSLLCRMAPSVSEGCRARASSVLSGGAPADPEACCDGFEGEDRSFLTWTAAFVNGRAEGERRLAAMVASA